MKFSCDTRWSTWVWWKTCALGELALPTDGALRSFCSGESLNRWSFVLHFHPLTLKRCANAHRYKPLCPETWPNWHGQLVDGVSTLVTHLGYKPEEYKLGRYVTRRRNTARLPGQREVKGVTCSILTSCRSKIFIRFPKTLFATEDALEAKKPDIGNSKRPGWRDGWVDGWYRQGFCTIKNIYIVLQVVYKWFQYEYLGIK